MKRARIEVESVTAFSNLIEASHRAALGKRDRPDVNAFFHSFDHSLSQVQSALGNARLPYGTYRSFAIRDPKPRVIHAAPFADRVAHHALMHLVEPPLDRWQPATSFACRRGKGVHTAVHYAQRQCRRYPWYLKMDVSGYFEHIDHGVLLQLLHQRLKGRWVFRLINAVLESYYSRPNKGLPIGALTSQQFANVYLVPADRWLVGHPLCRAHCRYMDDTVVWVDSHQAATTLWQEYRQMLREKLLLSLKPAVLQQSKRGLTLCGMRIRQEGLRPSRRRQRRFKQRLIHWEKAYASGDITILELQCRVDALVAMLAPGQSLHWRRSVLQHHVYPNILAELRP